MILETYHGGERFEVTPEMEMTLKSVVGPSEDDPTYAESVTQLRAALAAITKFPTGFWDAYLDEGHWDYDEKSQEYVQIPCDCPDGNHVGDDVFVRLPLGGIDQDLQIFVRGNEVTIGGETYTPEECVKDLMALLTVFRLFDQRGQLSEVTS